WHPSLPKVLKQVFLIVIITTQRRQPRWKKKKRAIRKVSLLMSNNHMYQNVDGAYWRTPSSLCLLQFMGRRCGV
ncbi:hypothetical protein L1887_30902, partial [Cichorium endivia]